MAAGSLTVDHLGSKASSEAEACDSSASINNARLQIEALPTIFQ